jgi:hypothetical protein
MRSDQVTFQPISGFSDELAQHKRVDGILPGGGSQSGVGQLAAKQEVRALGSVVAEAG